ncbi:hypothetical protein DK762_20365 [Salmonella enterica subsp. houtenae]|nr:hypothetical protein [Salmonella enterica subsp. houtenae]ECI3709050.1 hypothetical protein [Salmonella enterica subsp. houtenae]MLR86995.1 hypothetical protein [Salmonella enterica subsp. houtenae]
MAGNGRHTEKRWFYVHQRADGASAGSPGGAGGDICLWQFRKMALMRRRRGQFLLTTSLVGLGIT